jgi:hypothetical protein
MVKSGSAMFRFLRLRPPRSFWAALPGEEWPPDQPSRQGRAFRVWNGGAYKSRAAQRQGSFAALAARQAERANKLPLE